MILSRFQRFSIDNSMVKKLYTADDPDDKGDGNYKKKKTEGDKEDGAEEDGEPTLERFITGEERKSGIRNKADLN